MPRNKPIRHKYVLRILLPCCLIAFLANASIADDLRKATLVDKMAAKRVAKLIQERHLSNKTLNDDVSQKAFHAFVKALDPGKVYFEQSDLDEFSKRKTQLDDFLIEGDLTFAFELFERFLKRVDERVELAIKLVDAETDFTKDEEIKTDVDEIKFATNQQEIEDRWRKRIKYNMLVLKGEKDAKQKPEDRLKKRYRSFSRRMHQFDNDDIVEAFVTAITSAYDPHTSYMSKSTFKNFLIAMTLQLEGIGATLQSTDDGLTVIKRVVPGGALDKHGKVVVEDKIVAVGQGGSEEMVDITDMKLDDVVKMIRGKAGTVVRLGVMKPDNGEINTYSITREKIELKDSEARGKVFENGKKPDGSPYKVGVIDLPSFYSDMESGRSFFDSKSTTRDVRRLLKDFKKKGVDAVVLDLSQNGGGSLREAIDCTGLFIDKGPVVQVKDGYGELKPLNDTDRGMAWDGPLVVLTSKFSASASEILAGAVQDYGRGIVVGDTATHGKGTVQTLIDLDRYLGMENGPSDRVFGALKITIQQFYRPNGDSTQKRGVLADIVLPSITDHMDVGESDLDFALEFDKVKSARYSVLDMATKDLIADLTDLSIKRRDDSEKFQKREKDIKVYLEQKAKKSVSLNEEKFFARRKELNSDKVTEDTIDKQINPDGDIERDFYMDEVIRIATDYAEARNRGKN